MGSGAKPLENEGGNPFQPRQNRGSGVEQRPIAEIMVGVGHNGRPRRPRQSEHPDQPPALPELPVKPGRLDLGRVPSDRAASGRRHACAHSPDL